ncbi:MAG: V-type ATPase subunit, partial [Thermoplasmatales archaeon]
DLTKGFEFYKRRGSLDGIQMELNRNLYNQFIQILDMSALSINNVLAYLLRVEAEWMEIRNIALGRYYKIDDETIRMISMNLG